MAIRVISVLYDMPLCMQEQYKTTPFRSKLEADVYTMHPPETEKNSREKKISKIGQRQEIRFLSLFAWKYLSELKINN